MGLLYGRAGRLNTKNGGFRPGQVLAGFCVDYIVHLAHSFNECEDSSRVARVEYAVGHMGISVLGGCLTSLGASALLFFCTLQFFSSFGAFFFGTIILGAAVPRAAPMRD